ncbi:hypothetical protein [Sediminibacter sp. Hel_I_10]|uniref:hypothetical protein n=1 Tax=Sediminibacter sp. Hel_I_10 TaxID=1392490 RepID=UPI00068D42CE|nr:hypothetical protein [Sediminibacter sp. Hel_I_10]
MKSITIFLGLMLLFSVSSYGQVGIGTDSPDASSVLHLSGNGGLILPNLDTDTRNLITLPVNGLVIYNTDTEVAEINTGTPASPVWRALDTVDDTAPVVAPSVDNAGMAALAPATLGAIVYNTEQDCLFQYKSAGWQSVCEAESSKVVTLYRDLAGANNTITSSGSSSTFYNFPLGLAQVTEIDTDYFTVASGPSNNGKVTVLKDGSYSISASLSVQNLSQGTRKYILGVFRNGTRIGYLARGFATAPGTSEYFGASGTFQFKFNANDVVEIKYLIDNGANNLQGDLLHIGIVKL